MIRNQVLKHLPGAGEGERGENKGYLWGRATSREAMEKSRYVKVVEREEVRRDDQVEYFLLTEVGSTS